MTQEKERKADGSRRKEPDRLDVWFCWIASLVTAALIGFCLVSVFQIKLADRTSAAHYHPHVIG